LPIIIVWLDSAIYSIPLLRKVLRLKHLGFVVSSEALTRIIFIISGLSHFLIFNASVSDKLSVVGGNLLIPLATFPILGRDLK
jgi:hypothetical protein